MIKVFRSSRNLVFVLEEADKCVRGGFEFVCELLFEVRPRRASELAVCTGLESPRSSSGNSPCRCCGTD